MDGKTKIYVGIIVIILIIAALVYNSFGSNSALNAQIGQPVSQAQLSELNSIAQNTALANKVGQGVASNPPKAITANSLVTDTRPTALYIGAEYCPFCAATRWSLVIALMRFGQFTGLRYMTSSPSDVFASTPTFTFVNSTYTSSYVDFVAVETQNRTGAPLQNLTSWEQNIFGAYDSAGIPFIDFGNKSVQTGSIYGPGIIDNKDWGGIVSQINNSNSTVSQAVLGGANIFTAEICKMTGMQPSGICNATYVKNILAAGE